MEIQQGPEFLGHGKNLRFDSKYNGKPVPTGKEQPCLSSRCDHCWGVISPQRSAPADTARPGPRRDCVRNEGGLGQPTAEFWLEPDLLRPAWS